MKSRFYKWLIIVACLGFIVWMGQRYQTGLRSRRYEGLIQEGDRRLKAGKLKDAYEQAMSAAKSDPKRFEAYALAAFVLHRHRSYAKARELLDEALARVPAAKRDALLEFQSKLTPDIKSGSGTPAAGALNGEARRKLDVLGLIITEADKAKAPAERQRLLAEFLEKSESFLVENPMQTNIWILRAAAALELGDEAVGQTAGKRLVDMGADNQDNEQARKLMAMIERRGWLGAPSAARRKPQPRSPAASGWVNSLGIRFVPLPGSHVLFCVWKTRVSDFEAFARETGYDATAGMFSLRAGGWTQRGDNWRNPGFAQTPEHPVCGVSWADAKAFCTWLTRKEKSEGRLQPGQYYRLPTDAEWSQAVGTSTYPWGEEFPPPRGAGNYAGEEAKDENWPSHYGGIAGYLDGFARTSPVGSFAPNRLGLFDLGGNLWEWCENKDGGNVMVRGGSWVDSDPFYLGSSRRIFNTPDYRNGSNGFRLVLADAVSP